jgi:hypothetical protein
MELVFHRVYEMADLMAQIVEEDFDPFEELNWSSPAVNQCVGRFSKSSLLGHFCFTHIAINERRRFSKDSDLVSIELEQHAFQRYQIPCRPFEEYNHHQSREPDGEDAIRTWMRSQEEAFERLWERIADEVFHLLFANRGFLLNFNLGIASYRNGRTDSPCPRYAIPQWVKRAVYFRENGKCALCKKDLSGLVAVDPKQHYDHIVPLKALGINDPCNIQLLCNKCNLVKGASPARTSSMYDSWWT